MDQRMKQSLKKLHDTYQSKVDADCIRKIAENVDKGYLSTGCEYYISTDLRKKLQENKYAVTSRPGNEYRDSYVHVSWDLKSD